MQLPNDPRSELKASHADRTFTDHLPATQTKSWISRGRAQFLSEQPPHQILEDIRKFFGQIFAGSSATKPGLEQPPQTEGQSMS